MRYIRWIVLALVALALVTVALANRAPVTVRALPDGLSGLFGLAWAAEVPLFLVMLASGLLGVALGFVWEWLREHKHRATASAKTREAARLERELAVMRDTKTVPEDDVLALIDGSARK